MILTVTLNFAVDVTYHVDGWARGETTRVHTVNRRAGGKGVNVARVLHTLGREVVITGLSGGFTGQAARTELAAAGLNDALVPVAGESRLTVVVTEPDGVATGLSEPGPRVSPGEWDTFTRQFMALLASARAVVLAGSLPPGLPSGAYQQLAGAAAKAGVPVLLDATGDALLAGLRASPTVVKINATELAEAIPGADVGSGADALRRAGAGAVVISQGADGLTGLVDDRFLHAALPEPVRGNPTGAGDAASAALAVGMVEGTPWTKRLTDAVALSAAAVAAPEAGSFDARLYVNLQDRVTTRVWART